MALRDPGLSHNWPVGFRKKRPWSWTWAKSTEVVRVFHAVPYSSPVASQSQSGPSSRSLKALLVPDLALCSYENERIRILKDYLHLFAESLLWDSKEQHFILVRFLPHNQCGSAISKTIGWSHEVPGTTHLSLVKGKQYNKISPLFLPACWWWQFWSLNVITNHGKYHGI